MDGTAGSAQTAPDPVDASTGTTLTGGPRGRRGPYAGTSESQSAARPDEGSRCTRLDDGATSRSYLVLNLVGSTILTFLAAHEQMWGFLILEFFWALVSGWGLIRNLGAGRRPRLRTR
ncbi:MAG TPA: hypothetical protein VE526_17535 [Solirubrobacteraceae bacterium]|nr:hypothetical protein [Solirubrobacteraceae bacterium]